MTKQARIEQVGLNFQIIHADGIEVTEVDTIVAQPVTALDTIADTILALSPNTKQGIVSARMYARSYSMSGTQSWVQYWFNDGSSLVYGELNDTISLA